MLTNPSSFFQKYLRFKYLLKRTSRNANRSRHWLAKMPVISRDLELIVYVSAPSLQEYTDKESLKKRLFRAALDIKRNHCTKESDS